MASDQTFQQFSLSIISRRCAEESDRFLHHKAHDPRFCFEMFRRAIVDADQLAWELVCRQYQALVSAWVVRHPGLGTSGEEIDYFVNGAFVKMWSALTPQRFERFSDLASVLRYLHRCVQSVILDHTRRRAFSTFETTLEADTELGQAEGPRLEKDVLDQLFGETFWQSLNERLKNEKERRVIRSTFVHGLKPKQIQALFPKMFRTAKDVSRIKENVIARLRRDAEFKRFFDLG